MCKDLHLVKYFIFFSLTKAVIDMIFVDLGFAKKDLYLLFLGRNVQRLAFGQVFYIFLINKSSN
jgi:hypothetical protein